MILSELGQVEFGCGKSLDHIVLAPPFQVMTTDRIVEEAGINLIADELARVFRDGRRVHAAKTAIIVIPLLNHEWQPAAFILNGHNFQLRVSFQHAVKDQFKKSAGYVVQFQVHTAAVTLDSFSLLILIVAVARQNVQAYGRIQVRRRCPEFIIVARIKRKIRMWRLPDNGAFKSGLVAALQLLNADIYVIDRDGWNTDHPTVVGAAG